MGKEYNQIVFTRAQFDNDVYKMYEAIGKQIALLMITDNICVIYDDDKDIIIIQYEHNDKHDYFGVHQPMWLSPDEIEAIERCRENNWKEPDVKASEFND